MNAPGGVRLTPFYPIVPDAGWIAHLAPLGVRTVQLRFKSDDAAACKREVAAALCIAESFDRLTLIINDHWQAALELGATAVHLGQEDLAAADVAALKQAGIAVGISTHSDDELTTALAVEPDYVALGPVFETKLKTMPWQPQGLGRLSAWKHRIGTLPLVAIGGLNIERAGQALQAGAQSAAVITDFMTAANPTARIKDWLAWEQDVLAGGRQDEGSG